MPSHFVQTNNNIREACNLFDLIVKFRTQQYVPMVYISRVDLLPKLRLGSQSICG